MSVLSDKYPVIRMPNTEIFTRVASAFSAMAVVISEALRMRRVMLKQYGQSDW